MTVMTDTISTQELSEATGASIRRLDYWTRHSVIYPAVGATGSGTRRRWGAELIPGVRALVRINDALASGTRAGGLPAPLARLVIVAAARGDNHVSIGDGVVISWP